RVQSNRCCPSLTISQLYAPGCARIRTCCRASPRSVSKGVPAGEESCAPFGNSAGLGVSTRRGSRIYEAPSSMEGKTRDGLGNAPWRLLSMPPSREEKCGRSVDDGQPYDTRERREWLCIGDWGRGRGWRKKRVSNLIGLCIARLVLSAAAPCQHAGLNGPQTLNASALWMITTARLLTGRKHPFPLATQCGGPSPVPVVNKPQNNGNSLVNVSHGTQAFMKPKPRDFS
ncbi:hypothetical protein B0T16DRAFT_515430, partial [Cercophora newfieldiana]